MGIRHTSSFFCCRHCGVACTVAIPENDASERFGYYCGNEACEKYLSWFATSLAVPTQEDLHYLKQTFNIVYALEGAP